MSTFHWSQGASENVLCYQIWVCALGCMYINVKLKWKTVRIFWQGIIHVHVNISLKWEASENVSIKRMWYLMCVCVHVNISLTWEASENVSIKHIWYLMYTCVHINISLKWGASELCLHNCGIKLICVCMSTFHWSEGGQWECFVLLNGIMCV